MPNADNVNAPAPWVPYTRDGCNVGEVGMSNTVLENLATDIPTVFGAGSPQAAEAKADPDQATADIVGLAVHCAAGAAMCASGEQDALPDEPGGYHGYQALFGNAQIQPVVSPNGPVTALDGSTIADDEGNPGFPGFDSLTPTNSLGYAATLLEHGVQVDNIYVSDVHGDHTAAQTGDLGPGEQTYEQQLHAYDTAFGQFFTRLAHDGITPANTLFSVTTDEGDHFSGSAPTPADCTGNAGQLLHLRHAVRGQRQSARPARHAAGRHDPIRDPQRSRARVVGQGQPAGVQRIGPSAGPRHLGPVGRESADRADRQSPTSWPTRSRRRSSTSSPLTPPGRRR